MPIEARHSEFRYRTVLLNFVFIHIQMVILMADSLTIDEEKRRQDSTLLTNAADQINHALQNIQNLPEENCRTNRLYLLLSQLL